VVPYFDPGPWAATGWRGLWPSHGDAELCLVFDCVPEENSLLLAFGVTCVEIPAMNLTLLYPRELLGERCFLDSAPSSRFVSIFSTQWVVETFATGSSENPIHP